MNRPDATPDPRPTEENRPVTEAAPATPVDPASAVDPATSAAPANADPGASVSPSDSAPGTQIAPGMQACSGAPYQPSMPGAPYPPNASGAPYPPGTPYPPYYMPQTPPPTPKWKTNLRHIGSAAGYFAIYFGIQLAVSMAAGFLLSFLVGIQMGMDAALSGGSMDGILTGEQMTEQIMLRLTELIEKATVPILIVSQLVTVFVLWLIFKIRKKSLAEQTECRRIKPLTAGMALILGVSFSCLVQLFFTVVPIPDFLMDSYAESSSALSSGPILPLILASVILAPILEELVFRGLIYTRLRRIMPVWGAVLIVSALFGIMHGNLIWFLYTSVLGAVMALLFERTGSLITPIIIHFGFNLCGMLLGYLVGEELSVLELVLIGAVGVIGTAGTILAMVRESKPRPETAA